MVIVKTAKRNVKMNNEYRFVGNLQYSRDVQDVMVLFHFQPAAESALGNNRTLVTVECNDRQVVIQIDYLDDHGERVSQKLDSTIDQAESTEYPIVKRYIRLTLLEMLKRITGYDPGPWGILRGVRPTKLIHRMLDEGQSTEKIICDFSHRYGVTTEKARLATDIAVRQRPLLAQSGSTGKNVSVYIGIPYCPTRCLYCSFPGYTLPSKRSQVEEFLNALNMDMTNALASIKQHGLSVQAVYVGGGTPTSLADADFAHLLENIKQFFIGEHTSEFTVEAGRPDSITAEKIAAMGRAGVNRVSVNPQTMQQKTLEHIGRKHTVKDVIDVFHQFRQAAIGVINMDIIAGLPGETEQDMIDTMEKIASLGPDNLTVHTLALKKGSRLKTSISDHELPSEAVTGRMVGIAASYAIHMGMDPYYLYRQKYMTGNLENVGYSIPGKECLYNMQIMEERQTVIGIGPAAGTKAVNCHTFNLRKCYNAKDVLAYVSNLPIYLKQRQLLLDNLFVVGEEEITC